MPPSSASLYRRHRPRSFADVVGQEHVVRTLSNAIEQDKEPLDSGRDGAKALEVLLAISESARLRGKVALPLEQEAASLDLMAAEGRR